jgi:tetratricopeptide (TPR) repeat protein
LTRKRLKAYPSNSILWIDLAYLYAVGGSAVKAERAVRVALNLSPANRFVLRSAARFYIHKNRPDVAHDIIRRAPGLIDDPWLVAAEISIALAAKRTPWKVKEGLSLLNGGKFPMSHLSELSSALGTLEFNSGSNSKAKKFFRQSLLAPNDNSLAQAQWISRSMSGLRVNAQATNVQVARAFEANAYQCCASADWQGAADASLLWLVDQPFSSRPARMAAYLAASIFEDFKRSEEIVKFALAANPDEPSYHINLAYCYANTGRTQEATEQLKKVKIVEDEEWADAAREANYGLIAFRQGMAQLGRARYEEAVRKAGLLDDKRTKVSALIHWSTEEIGLSDSNSERLYDLASEAATKSPDPDMLFHLKRLRERIDVSKLGGILPLTGLTNH